VKAILLNRILLLLAFVGLFIAGSLSLEKLLNLQLPCGTAGGCTVVTSHPSSIWFGVPVAYIGFLGYLALAGLAIARALGGVYENRKLVTAGYIVAAIGTVVSLALQYQSLIVIKQVCTWCLSSAVTMVITLIVHALLAQEVESTATSDRETYRVPQTDRLLLGALPVVLAVAVGISGLSMKRAVDASTPKIAPTAKAADLIPTDKANSFGTAEAPVTVVEFADMLCPSCAQTSPKVKDFIQANPGKFRLIYRHFPLDRHPQALTAAVVSEVAADEGKFWDFTMQVMALPEEPQNADQIFEIAKRVGLDVEKVKARLSNSDDAAYGRIERDMKVVELFKINSTPTFFIIKNGEVEVTGPGQILAKLQEPKYLAQAGG